MMDILILAIIEFERRFIGNTTDVQLPEKGVVERSDREMVATLLDLRTVHTLSKEDSSKAKDLLEDEYIKFSVQYHEYGRAEAKKQQAVATAAVPTATTGSGEVTKKQKSEAAESSKAMLGICYSAAMKGSNFDTTDEEDDSEDEVVAAPTEEQLQKDDRESAAKEFKRVFRQWRKYKVDWQKLYKENNLPENLDMIRDLMGLDIGVLYKSLESESKFGFLPLMASCSKGQIRALNAESYAERVNSCGKLVLTDGNSLLSDEETEMLVTLRMNREFMEHMRQNYPAAVKEAYGRTIVSNTPDPC